MSSASSDKTNAEIFMRNYRSVLGTFLSLLLMVFTSCSWISRKSITSQYYRDRGELIVLTKNSPISRYEDKTGETVGFEHDLIMDFAKAQGVSARFVVKDSDAEIVEELKIGGAHLAAASFLSSQKFEGVDTLFGPEIMDVFDRVICHKSVRGKKLKNLSGKRVVLSYERPEDRLRVEGLLSGLVKDVEFVGDEELGIPHWLDAVNENRVACMVASSLMLGLHPSKLPHLRIVAELEPVQKIGFVLPSSQKRLLSDLQTWAKSLAEEERMQTFVSRYFGAESEIDFYDTEIFLKRIRSVLPSLKDRFLLAAKKTEIDWRLLAAVGYQESHWNPLARSPTGVRGVMMLTHVTAKEMGVKDRLDPTESIDGGSRYLRRLINRVPPYIQGEERYFLALAAYNIGWAHLIDARKLAVEQGKNPNSWEDLAQVFPLLARPKYYKRLRHGYARGNEPVVYVSRIRRYYDLLKVEFGSDGESISTN